LTKSAAAVGASPVIQLASAHLDRLKTAMTRNGAGTVTDDYTYTYDGTGNMTKSVAKANRGATTTTRTAGS
jgi:hypothetical protein